MAKVTKAETSGLLESLSCDNCGSLILVPRTTSFATCAHCGCRLTIGRTATASYTRVRDRSRLFAGPGNGKQAEKIPLDLEAISARAMAELEELDQLWSMRVEEFPLQSGDFWSSLPMALVRLALCLVGAMFGIVSYIVEPSTNALIIIGACLAALPYAIRSLARARDYWNARREYSRRRREILSSLKSFRRL